MGYYNRNDTTWESADGQHILIKDLSTTHLVNILNWIKTNNSVYSDDIYHFMEREVVHRKILAFTTNGAIPVKLDTGFYTVINQTLSERLKSLIAMKKSRVIMSLQENPTWLKSLIVNTLKVKKKIDL